MEKIPQLLRDPLWWITSVFVAIAVNLFSSYLGKWIDVWLAHRNERVAIKTAKRLLSDASFYAKLQELESDPLKVIALLIQSKEEGFQSIVLLVFAAAQLMHFWVEYSHNPGSYTYLILGVTLFPLTGLVVFARQSIYRSQLLKEYAPRVS